jgi:hypothetical protein
VHRVGPIRTNRERIVCNAAYRYAHD